MDSISSAVTDVSIGSILGLAAWLVPIGLALWFGVRFMRAYERRTETASDTRVLKERMLRLEKRLEELSENVRGIAEAQRFGSSPLAERERSVQGKGDVPPGDRERPRE